MDFGKLPTKRPATPDTPPTASPLPESRPPTPLATTGQLYRPTTLKKVPDLRQNALIIFEFSTAYPFVYGNNKFKCFICAQPYLDMTMLKQHMHETHTFASLKRLVNNRRENILKVDVNNINCKLCPAKPKDLVELKQHLKIDHKKPVDPELHDNLIPFRLNSTNGPYECVVCQETFIKVRILVIHMSIHFNNYSCEVCGSGFMTLRLLKKHLEVHETGNYPCDRCEKVFSTAYKRTLHVRGVHLKQFPRRCPFCPERFNSNYKRTIHLQDVHNQSTRVHKCQTCGRGFNLKYHLICHTRSVHMQERNQQCDVCHQRFCNKETLKRHMVIHTGEKNHKCHVCGMAFLRRKNLKDHLRLHDLGLIEETNSTLILKDGDGSDIKLKLLKVPIPLGDLKCQYEDTKQSYKNAYNKIKFRNVKRKASISFLKEPISLDSIDWEPDNEEITFHVQTIQGSCVSEIIRKKTKTEQKWKENALTIFENSFVYPFIHASNKYKCFICSQQFLEAAPLKEHSLTHNIKELRKELNNRVRDKNIKVDVTYTQCKICLESLPDLKTLNNHLREHGKKLDLDCQDNLIPFKLNGENFQCQVCGESYLKLRLLIIHMSKHFNNYSCEVCGSVFISLTLLKRHLQTHETGNFPCDKCDKVFSNSAKRTLHMRGVHLKQFPRRCPICPERFNSNYQRTKHLRIVHNQSTGLFRCETCGREYDLKYHLLVHIRSVHLQERNQECPICHSRFFSKYCLSRHMVIHTGEKNFKCDVCGKAYTRKKNLREHSRMHTGHACTVCGQNFVDQTVLVAHVNSHGIL